MVTNDEPERKDTATCNLSLIKELASRRQVSYAKSRVQTTVANLGYSLEDVCDCLELLEPCNFKEALRYKPARYWLDVYKITVTFDGWTDDLYIKLKLSSDCVVVDLFSFHRD